MEGSRLVAYTATSCLVRAYTGPIALPDGMIGNLSRMGTPGSSLLGTRQTPKPGLSLGAEYEYTLRLSISFYLIRGDVSTTGKQRQANAGGDAKLRSARVRLGRAVNRPESGLDWSGYGCTTCRLHGRP